MDQPAARAAIYARISSDIEGKGAGVARQIEDCRALAESLGWTVAGEYIDNDVSAYSGRVRPEYQRLMSDIADGSVDGLIVWHQDRLHRRPVELERFFGAIDRAGIANRVRSVTGNSDFGSGDGIFTARIMAAVAANESASKSRRVARKHQQNAAEGKPHKSGVRPFGYDSDFITIRNEEAEVYRQIVARFLAGESTRSLATWLNDQQVATVTGVDWVTSTLKGMLTNPRYAALRAHRGKVVGPGIWEPIITEDDHRRILAKFAEKKGSGRRAPQRYLLSGLLRCSKCSNRLFSSARRENSANGSSTRRYVCSSGPDHGGCGKLTIVADPLERLVADAVLFRLDTPELADALAGRSSTDQRVKELTETVDRAREQEEELAAAYANGDINMREWMTAKKPIAARLETAQRQLAAASGSSALNGLVGNGEELGRSWNGLNLTRQHAIVNALIDHIVIQPGTRGARELDRSRVDIVWRH